MNEPSSYPRSSTVRILTVVALGLFALNFSTAVSRHWGDVSFAHRGCPWHESHMMGIRAPAVQVEPVVSVDWDQIHMEIARAQEEAARARCDMRRFHKEWEARAATRAPLPPLPPAPPVPITVMQ